MNVVCFSFCVLMKSRYITSTVSRIALVSPERAKQIEEILLRMAQSGQLRGRVSEEQLIGFLDQVRYSQFHMQSTANRNADGRF